MIFRKGCILMFRLNTILRVLRYNLPLSFWSPLLSLFHRMVFIPTQMADSERRVVYRRAVPLSNDELRDVQRVTRVYQSNDPLDARIPSRTTPYSNMTSGTYVSPNDVFHQDHERSSRFDRHTDKHVDTGNAIHHIRDGLHELFSGEKPKHIHTAASPTRGRDALRDTFSPNYDSTRLYSTSERPYDQSPLYGRETYERNDINDAHPRKVYAGHNQGFDQPSTFTPAPTASSSASSGLRVETGSVAANLQRSRLGYLANPLVDPEADTKVHSSRDSFSSSWRDRCGRAGSKRTEAVNGTLGSAMEYNYGQSSGRHPAREDIFFTEDNGRIAARSPMNSFRPLSLESVGTNGNYTTSMDRDQREMVVTPRGTGIMNTNGTRTHSEEKMDRWMHNSMGTHGQTQLSCGHVSPRNESEKLQMQRLHDNNLYV